MADISSIALYAMSIGCYIPNLCWDMAETPRSEYSKLTGSLEIISSEIHWNTLKNHSGKIEECLNQQQKWLSNLSSAMKDTLIFTEPTKSLSEMVMDALPESLLPFPGTQCLAINCQNTRDSDYGFSTASKVLYEKGLVGWGFTIGHCGFVASYRALEIAAVLARTESPTAIILTAVERWLDIYPRILGRWALLSDGAAACSLVLRNDARATGWVTTTQLNNHQLLDALNSADLLDTDVSTLCETMDRLIMEADLGRNAKVQLLSPETDAEYARKIRRLAKKIPSIATSLDGNPRTYFGSADALIRLNMAAGNLTGRFDCQDSTYLRPDAYLVWDLDPSGVFGAALFHRELFEQSPRGATQ